MAGVYIKGYGGRFCELNVCMFTGESQPISDQEERISNCPIVPVPDHGDLIDREEAMKKHSSWFYEGDDVCESIKSAPVVIPADKESAG